MQTRSLVTFGLEQLTTGLFPGAASEAVPFWASAADVVFDGAGVIPTQGYREIVLQSGLWDAALGNWDSGTGLWDDRTTTVSLTKINGDPITGAHQQIQSDGQRLIIWGTETALYKFAASTVNVTRPSGPYTASTTDKRTAWSFAQWGDWVLAANGKDKPQVLKTGAARFVDLANFPAATAEIVRVLGAHALFFNLTGTYAPTSTPAQSNQFVWCKRDDVEAWSPLLHATAGELVVRAAPGGFVCVEPLRDGLIAYTTQTAHIITQDPTFLFAVQSGAIGTRVGGKYAVAVASDLHYYITEAGIFATDGLTIAPVAAPKLGDWLRLNVNWSRREQVVALVNMRQNLLKWQLPGAPNRVLTCNLSNQTLSFESTAYSAATRGVGPHPAVIGTLNGEIRELGAVSSGTLPEMVTKPLALSNRDAFTFLDKIVLRHQRLQGTLQWRVGDTEDECVAAGWQTLGAVGPVESMWDLMREAVYVQFRLTMVPGAEWLLSGIELLGKPAGRRY